MAKLLALDATDKYVVANPKGDTSPTDTYKFDKPEVDI